jgi:O-antigen/teichoic acid export membrane protein
MGKVFNQILKVSGNKTIAAIAMMVVGIILARVLGPEGRGLYAAILVVPMLIISFAELGIKRSTIYHVGKKLYKEEDIVSALIVTVLFTSTIGVVICAFFFFFNDNPEFTLPLIILAVFRIPLRLFRKYAGGFFLGKQQFNRSIFLNWLFVITYTATIVLFLLIFKMYVLGALISLVISNLIVSIVALFYLLRSNPVKLSGELKVALGLIKLGLVYAVAIFIMKIHTKIDIYLLNELSSLDQVGYYSISSRLAEKWQIPFSIGGIIIAKSANAKNHSLMNANIAKLFRVTFLFGTLSMLVLFFVAPFLVPLLYGGAWTPSVEIVQYILPGILMLILAKVMGTRLAGIGKPWVFMFVAIPALIINITLNFLWIPGSGGLGAAMATNVSYTFLTLTGLFVYARVVKMPVWDIIRFRKSDFDFVPYLIKRTLKKLGLKR